MLHFMVFCCSDKERHTTSLVWFRSRCHAAAADSTIQNNSEPSTWQSWIKLSASLRHSKPFWVSAPPECWKPQTQEKHLNARFPPSFPDVSQTLSLAPMLDLCLSRTVPYRVRTHRRVPLTTCRTTPPHTLSTNSLSKVTTRWEDPPTVFG